LHLAECGAAVAVIDSCDIGAGTSGRANGQVMADLTLPPARIVQLYGAERGEALLRTSATAPDLVFELISQHQIACDAMRTGWIEASPFEGGLRRMERRVASWRERGAPVELLDRDTLRQLTGTNAYVNGLLDRRGGTINPLSYNRGLAIAAVRHGAAFQKAEARALLRHAGAWKVVTARGDVTAGAVIVATNAYTGRLVPHLRLPIVCLYGAQTATGPLPPHLHYILPQRQGFSDVRKRFLRLDAQHRLIIGGPAGFWAPASGRSLPFRWIEHALLKLFPELRAVQFEHRWLAKGAAAADLLPHAYEPAPGLLTALGFAGRGIAMGTALGRVLAQRVQGEGGQRLAFPMTPGRLPLGLGGLLH
jgi:glycine/D-amino acid oxidase-like deaminating enzyme